MPLRTGPRAIAGVLLVVVAALGLAGGVALERFVLDPQQPPRAPRHSAERAHVYSRYLAKELGLSAEQERTVDSILVARQAQSRAVAAQVKPRFDSITVATRADLDRVLTPPQRTKYADLRERHRRERARTSAETK
jgi:hypothetical protein